MILRHFLVFGATAIGLIASEVPPAADWIEPDFPFFTSTLDARHAGSGFPTDNLTPRGIILNLGHGCWVCFDTDLLRVAAIWSGDAVSRKALATISYDHPDRKPPPGQFPAPEPLGKLWLANGIYPGWQRGAAANLTDPREPAPSPEEVGRGPLPPDDGQFEGIDLTEAGAVLRYRVGTRQIRELMRADVQSGSDVIARHIEAGPSTTDSLLVIGSTADQVTVAVSSGLKVETLPAAGSGAPVKTVRIPASPQLTSFVVEFGHDGPPRVREERKLSRTPPPVRWPGEATSSISYAKDDAPYVIDRIALPQENPWRRRVRISDIQFLSDGTGVAVTVDGDVWFVRGLDARDGQVHWRRFASGLHEPMSLAIRNDEIFVFDREGIWRLKDTDHNGEADGYDMFCDRFAQTADMRELPATIRLSKDGEFVIAKGGQASTTLGKHNGSILKISADGTQATVLGYGFRQPSLGANPKTGMVIASDQEGNYVPTTPLEEVKGGQFYGFLSKLLPREVYPAPIADPLVWIPHDVDASGISLLWLYGARMGPLNDQLVHIGFNPPELYLVLPDRRVRRHQAAVVSVIRGFETPTLNAAVNPRDGQLYIAGFQIVGWEATPIPTISGLSRVRYTGRASMLPTEVAATKEGMLLRFSVPLDAASATEGGNFSVNSWHYVRTYNYGSPKLKADGNVGIDTLDVSHAYLSQDRRSIFVAVPDMKPVMQLRVGWALRTQAGERCEGAAYLTPYELSEFKPAAEGFGEVEIDLSAHPPAPAAKPKEIVSVEEGRRISQLYGCVGCHASGPLAAGEKLVGPPWIGLYGRTRRFPPDGTAITADEKYLRESIKNPSAKITPGYESVETGMPNYGGVLSDAQVESLILYIKTLK